MPLRVRLVAGLLVLVAVGLAATGAAAVLVLRGYLIHRVDGQLRPVATQIAGRLDHDVQGAQLGLGVQHDPLEVPSAYYLQISDEAGHVAGPSPSQLRPGQQPPALPSWSPGQAAARDGQPFTVSAVSGTGSWRVIAVPLRTAPYTVFVGVNIDDTANTAHRLIVIDALVSLAVLVLLGGLAYWLVWASLRPLRDVERTAGAIAAGDLSMRVIHDDPRTEVGRLGSAFNAMVAHIEQAFGARAASEARARASAEHARQSEQQMRQFVADASHELRTPLTSIRGFAELYRHGAIHEPPDVARAMGRIEDESTRMGVLVEDLLLLARLDQHRPLKHAPVDLRRLVADAAADAAAIAPDRPIRTELASADPVLVDGDDARLRQVLGNLVGNALRHTPDSATITLRLAARPTPDGGQALLEVADEGPGMTETDAARVFERFYRADAARSRTNGGSGLGLAIVAGLTAAHGGSCDLRTAPGAGATFTLRLPLAAGADASVGTS